MVKPRSRGSSGLPKLPSLIDRKIYKTGQTRGSDDDQIYQNRVSRSSTVLIPLSSFDICRQPDDAEQYENGFIVLVPPKWYLDSTNPKKALREMGLEIGKNALLFFEERRDWETFSPQIKDWRPASSRSNPLGGEFVARIPGNTSISKGSRIIEGFETTSNKGAGIRVYEYASSERVKQCRLQLEAVLWLCKDSIEVLEELGMTSAEVSLRREKALEVAEEEGMLDLAIMKERRIINRKNFACCPLCLEELSAMGFASRIAQASGREVSDLTVTELSLFHIDELRVGNFMHKPYNLGWGHHHCNVTAKDAGIKGTLDWMKQVISRNADEGLSL